ncbi:MAG TPA: homoserine O-succinyltransferase [Sphingomicrobium sp.]|jgi:homoserine O-acetyltransferase|nr:homoserine O-succinyltransferase [Sphingomicrobium sp.]
MRGDAGQEVTINGATQETARNSSSPSGRGEFTIELSLVHAGPTAVLVRYELVGREGSPLVLVAGGISAGRHVAENPSDESDGWWQSQARSFESRRVLAIDWVGADGMLDRAIDPSDQARALIATLDHLGLSSAAAFVGASYGGMVGMHLAAIAPNRVGALLAISAADRAHPFATALRATQRQAIELGERLGAPEAGVALARKLAIISYRTPQEFAGRFSAPVTIEQGRAQASSESYLDHMGRRHSDRMSAAAYRRLSESIDLHRMDPALITIPSTFVAALSDQLVPAEDIEACARAAPRGRFISIPSLYGHDAFLKEERTIGEILTNFLNPLENQQ